MVEVMIGLIYFIGVVLAWPVTARYISRMDKAYDVGTTPSQDIVTGVVLGFMAAWFWPLLVPGVGVYQIVKHWD